MMIYSRLCFSLFLHHFYHVRTWSAFRCILLLPHFYCPSIFLSTNTKLRLRNESNLTYPNPKKATILLVGYFVLGPSDLYKLVKEIGKFIQNIRTLGTEATKTFENSMESQFELQEIRKAQRDLNDAFSFRRSINVNQEADAFTETAGPVEPEMGVAAAAAISTADASALPERKKKRKRVKRKPPIPAPGTESSTGGVPDLDMSKFFATDEPTSTTLSTSSNSREDNDDWFTDGAPSASDMAKDDMAWLESSELDLSKKSTIPTAARGDPDDFASAEQLRFQQQLSAQWNQKVVDNEDKLSPLAMIMEKLALLEEEKATADKRLEDEFRQRFQLDEDFYRKKRELLEEAAVKIQEDAYVTMEGATSGSDSKK
jgi:Sec-independent protein translocase protein TatA